jgi:hypothetical protein
MRIITTFLLLGLTYINLNAQSLEWITTGAGDYINSKKNIGYSVVSNDNSVYITGYAAGNNTRIQDSTINYGNFSFLAKYDISGDLKWLKTNQGVDGTDAAINSKNEIYTAYTTLYQECIILKFNQNGSILWNKQINNIDRITSITIDKMDNLILTGDYYSFKDSLIIEDTVIYDIIRNRTNSFIIKYNSNGQFEWFNTTKIISGNGGSVVFNDIQSDNNEDIIAIGDFELNDENDSLQIGDFYLNSESNPNYAPNYISHKDIVLTKLDKNGTFLWAKKIGGYKDDLGNRLAVSELNEVFIVGNYTDSVYFDDIKLTSCGIDIFLSKLSSTGDIEWVNKLGSNSCNLTSEEGRSVSIDENKVYIGGRYPGSFFHFGSTNSNDTIIYNGSNTYAGFIASYSLDGDFISVFNLKSTEDARIEDICVNDENIYITGNFYPPSTFFNNAIPTVYSNTNHFFLASLSASSPTNLTKIDRNKIIYYPNPAKDIIIIELQKDENIVISFCDISGRTLLSQRCFSGNNKIDISSLKEGIYIFKVYKDNEMYTDKFIKIE